MSCHAAIFWGIHNCVKSCEDMERSSARGFQGEVAMSRVVLIGERWGWRCRAGKLEEVGRRCKALNTSTAGEYPVKRADIVESMST